MSAADVNLSALVVEWTNAAGLTTAAYTNLDHVMGDGASTPDEKTIAAENAERSSKRSHTIV
jgi:hypothetical protein